MCGVVICSFQLNGELLETARIRFTRWIFPNGPDPGNLIIAPRPEQFLALCGRPHSARILQGIIMTYKKKLKRNNRKKYTRITRIYQIGQMGSESKVAVLLETRKRASEHCSTSKSNMSWHCWHTLISFFCSVCARSGDPSSHFR